VLTIRASDHKDYAFLVKGGEDLRLDQRVMQLFHVMNAQLCADLPCAKRGLLVRTYEVAPLSRRVGLIEWVPNTTTLKSVITDQQLLLDAQQNRKRGAKPFDEWMHAHILWVADTAGKLKPRKAGEKELPPACPQNFQCLLERGSRTVVVDKFHELQVRTCVLCLMMLLFVFL
jgi:hypothetical protein